MTIDIVVNRDGFIYDNVLSIVTESVLHWKCIKSSSEDDDSGGSLGVNCVPGADPAIQLSVQRFIRADATYHRVRAEGIPKG